MSEVITTPKLRFPEFSGEWKSERIEEMFVFKNGLNKEKEFFGKGTPIINFNDVYHLSGINESDIKGLVKLNNSEKERFIAKKGDVFFTRTSETIIDIGMSAVLIDDVKDCVFSGFTLRASPINDKLNLNFKKYCFSVHSVRKEIVTKSSFTTRALTSGTLLNKVIFRYPNSKVEQQKIAAFLTAVDNKIEQLGKNQELLGEYKKGLMQKIFSQAIRFKADDGSDYPDWEEKRLGEFLIHQSYRNLDNQIDLVLSVNNKKGFITQREQFDGHQVASRDLTNYKIVNYDDYAYNPSRINVGSIARLKSFEEGIVSPMYVIFKLINLNNIFFDNLLKSHWFKHLIKIGCSGSVRDSLNFDDMADFNLNIPSITEQEKIGNFLSSIDSKIEQIGKQLDEAKQFKKALLQQMFV